jgi:hypothetical protein
MTKVFEHMYSPDNEVVLRHFNYGIRVDRATANTPQTGNYALFNVLGGRVLVRQLIGEVSGTALQGAANNTNINSTPTVGSAVDLCAVLDTTGIEIGGKLVLPAAVGSALLKANAGGIATPSLGLCVAVGTIRLVCAASRTGKIKWSIFYVPLDEGAYVTAA